MKRMKRMKFPFQQYKIHAMDMTHVLVKEIRHPKILLNSVFSEYYNQWLFSDGTTIFNCFNTNHIVFESTKSILELYSINETLVMIHKSSYSSFNCKSKCISEYSFDGMSFCTLLYGLVIWETDLYFLICDVQSNTQNKLKKNVIQSQIAYHQLINNFKMFHIENSSLCHSNKIYEIPFFDNNNHYRLHIANDTTLVISTKVSHKIEAVIHFDLIDEKFGSWMHVRKFLEIKHLIKIHKTLIVFNEQFFVFDHKDLVEFLSSPFAIQIMTRIYNGCESMVFYKDYKSPICVDTNEEYVYYVSNSTLMATAISYPYDMHIICKLPKCVEYMNVNHREIIIQFTDIDIQTIQL